jgi:lysozyme family protein
MKYVLDVEGGYVNDPDDPGGETNMGISKRSYPDEDIRGMTVKRATDIYWGDFWAPVRAHDFARSGSRGLAIAMFDTAIHSGQRRAFRLLGESLGYEDAEVPSGILVAAATRRPARSAVLDAFILERLEWLSGLSTARKYFRGWFNRIRMMRAVAREVDTW